MATVTKMRFVGSKPGVLR